MSKLANALLQLRKERDQAQRRLGQLEALKALASLGGSPGRLARPHTSGERRRTISAAARKRRARRPSRHVGESGERPSATKPRAQGATKEKIEG
jgi:hypothetical protein